MQERTCPVCRTTFVPRTKNQLYCPSVDGKRSQCARRAMNHAQRTREGRTTVALDAPLARPFVCEECGTPCIPGERGVAYHASRFCSAQCKTEWHRREITRPREQEDRLLASFTTPMHRDEVAYARALRRDPCSYCGEPAQARDHIVPKSHGGGDDWTNRTGACHRCNGSKMQTPLLIFLAWKQARDEFEPWRAIVAAIHTRENYQPKAA